MLGTLLSPPLPEPDGALVCRFFERYGIANDANKLKRLYDDFEAVALARHDAARAMGGGSWYSYPPLPLPYEEELQELGAMMARVAAPRGWSTPLEDANSSLGSLLEGLDSDWSDEVKSHVFRGLLHWPLAQEMLEKWRTPDGTLATWEGFFAAFDDKACSDWSRMDERGECFGGAWKAHEGSAEQANASLICRERNARALFAMPYPKRAVLWTAVEHGCSTRAESVPFTKVLCEWMRRKLAQCTRADLDVD